MSVHVLRLGHRPARDKRLTTHLMLAARAFGALGATYTGTKDFELEETVRGITSDWGGAFSLDFAQDGLKVIKCWKRLGKIIHLTMYGLPLGRAIPEIRGEPLDKLVVVGGAKVPGEVFGLADWNVAVTSQPHSEVSALAVFLHELFQGGELGLVFEGARLKIEPQERGKRVRFAFEVV